MALKSDDDLVEIVPRAVTIVHDLASQIELAVRGIGILSAPLDTTSNLVASGRLSRVLPHWSTSMEALYLYFPASRHQSTALRAFVAFLKSSVDLQARLAMKLS